MLLPKRVFKSEDLFFRTLCAVFGAHVMVVFGVETSFFEAILNPVYYKAMAGSLLIALPVVEYTAFISRRLDQKWDWIQKPLERGLLQALFGVIITSVITFLLASIYFYVRGINIFDTLYLRIDFPLVVCLLLVMNLLFVLQYFYRYVRSQGQAAKALSPETTEENLGNLLVRSGNQTLSLHPAEIAFFYLEEDNRYLRTLQGGKLMVSQSLEELEARFGPAGFFRANRQVIISRKACQGFSVIEFGKLALICKPEFSETIIVSQRKAREFRQWFAGSASAIPAS